MTTEYLREFLTLVETGNFSAAAEPHFISEATLSRHIKALEEDLGVTLFNRLPRRIELTEMGVVFLPYARMIVASENTGINILKSRIDAGKSDLSIGIDPSLGAYNVVQLLAGFHERHPNIILNLTEAGTFTLREQLSEGSIQAAFIFDNKDVRNDNLSYIEFCQDILVAVLPAAHPLAKHKNVALNALAEEEILLAPRFTALHEMCSKAFRRSKCEPHSRTTVCYSGRIISDLIQNEMCITILPKQLALELNGESISTCDIAPTNVINTALAYSTQKSSGALNYFVDYIREVLDA